LKKSTPKEDNSIDNPEEVLSQLKELYEKTKSETTMECIKVCEEKIKCANEKKEKKSSKQKAKNCRIFKKIIKPLQTNPNRYCRYCLTLHVSLYLCKNTTVASRIRSRFRNRLFGRMHFPG